MNPAMNTRIDSGDQIFALAEDDDKMHVSALGRIPIDENLIRKTGKAPRPGRRRLSSLAGTVQARPSSANWIIM